MNKSIVENIREKWENLLIHSFIFKNKNIILLHLISLFMLIWFFPRIANPVYAGLDASWQFALNYFFVHDIQIGKDILFTFGPLGFLNAPQPLGNNWIIAFTIALPSTYLFNFSFLYLAYLIGNSQEKLNISMTIKSFAILFLLNNLINFGLLFTILSITLILIYKENKNKVFLFLSTLFCVAGFLMKSQYGLLALSVLSMHFLYDLVKERKISEILSLTVMLLAIVLSTWLLFYGNLEGLLDYYYSSKEFAIGYATIMSVNPEHHWLLLIGSFVSIILIPIVSREKSIVYLFVIFIFFLYLGGRYAFIRSSGLYFFIIMLFILYAYALLYLKQKKIIVVLLMILSLFLFNKNSQEIKIGEYDFLSLIKLIGNKALSPSPYINEVLNLDKTYEENLKASYINVHVNKLNKKILQELNKSTVDFYPVETTYAFANQINWQPRPVFQAYTAYTPWLDKKNFDFIINPKKAPKFILWDRTSMISIDGRYLLNDEPLTIHAIMDNYNIVYQDDKHALLERNVKKNFGDPISINSKAIHDQWIKIPRFDNEGIMIAKIKFSRTFIASIKRSLYKEDYIHVEYKLETGEVKEYRLPVDNIISGLWVNPLITDFSHSRNAFDKVNVDSFRIICSKKNMLEPEISIEWNYFPIINSKFILNDQTEETKAAMSRISLPIVEKQMKYNFETINQNNKWLFLSGWFFSEKLSTDFDIVLKSRSNCYSYKVARSIRPDVNDYFKVNFLNPGFSLHIKTNEIIPGDYQIYFVNNDTKDRYYVKTDKNIHISGEKNQ